MNQHWSKFKNDFQSSIIKQFAANLYKTFLSCSFFFLSLPQIVLRKYLMLKETERQKAEASFFVSINFIYLLLKCVKSLSILFMVYNCAVCNLIFGKIVFNKTQAKLSAFGRSKNIAFHFFYNNIRQYNCILCFLEPEFVIFYAAPIYKMDLAILRFHKSTNITS